MIRYKGIPNSYDVQDIFSWFINWDLVLAKSHFEVLGIIQGVLFLAESHRYLNLWQRHKGI